MSFAKRKGSPPSPHSTLCDNSHIEVKAAVGSQRLTQGPWGMALTPVKLIVLNSILLIVQIKITLHELIQGNSREYHFRKTHMKSAEMHADELHLKIFLEILLGRIAGLFYNRPMSNIKCKHHKATVFTVL